MKLIASFFSFLFLIGQIYGQELFKGIEVQTPSGVELPLTSTLKHDKDQIVLLYVWGGVQDSLEGAEGLVELGRYLYEELKDSFNVKTVALNLTPDISPEDLKGFVVDNDWYFDNYYEGSGKFQEKTGIKSLPQWYLIVNEKIVVQNEMLDLSIYEETEISWNIYYRIYYHGKTIRNRDENLIYIDEVDDEYLEYVDEKGGKFLSTIRYSEGGELLRKGTYLDSWTTIRDGLFQSFYRNGNKMNEKTYINGLQEGKSSTWYSDGQLKSIYHFKANKISHIEAIYDAEGNALPNGNLTDGTGFLYTYDSEGKGIKLLKVPYREGIIQGEVVKYGNEGNEVGRYLFNDGVLVKVIK